MNGPSCTSCGAAVDGMRFCTSCGAPVSAPPQDPYDYLFAEPAHEGPREESRPQVEYPTMKRPAVSEAPVAPRRRSAGWAWVAASAVMLAVVVAAGVSLTLGHHRDAADGATRSSAGTGGAPARGGTSEGRPSASASSSPSAAHAAPGAHAPATVAGRVRGLLAQEVAAHRADNAAVGAMLTCTHMAANRRTITSFAATRRRLAGRLAGVPSSTSPRLDAVTHRLLSTWRSLTPVDRAYASWAGAVRRSRHHCHVPAAPATSQASKLGRQQLRDGWVALLRGHPQWHVPQVRPLIDSGRHGLAYLLL